MSGTIRRRIVVGVDDSAESRLALQWAADYAERFDTEMVVVHAYRGERSMSTGYLSSDVPDDRRALTARDMIDAVIDDALDGESRVGRITERVTAAGSAAKVLVEQCDGADLLVVGSGGHSGIPGVLLGSVAERCAREAPCPVVVVRPVRQSSAHVVRVVRVTSAIPDSRVAVDESTGAAVVDRSGPS